MNISEMQELIIHQLKNIFTLDQQEEHLLDEEIISKAASNAMRCMENMSNKYYSPKASQNKQRGGIELYNSVMNCNFLYWLSRELFLEKESRLADKVYYLNKALNSVELFYEVELPDIWSCEHPLGSVMGKAQYGNYFYFYQGCTVGGNFKKDGSIIYPRIGHHVKMFSNSKILGDSNIGNNVIISANCLVKNQNVPNDTIVFGQSPYLVFKENYFKGM